MKPNLGRLAAAFDPARMDALLLLAPTATSIGYAGRGDFAMAPDGRLARRGEREVVAVRLCRRGDALARLFAGAPAGAFSLTPLFDRAAEPGGSRPAPRRRVDACRHARGDQSRRGGHPRQRGLIV